MATIFFSMAGEGRGHATRVTAVVEQLRCEHSLVLFASSHAFDLLSARYQGTAAVEVRRIPGLQFSYRHGRLDYARSLWQSLPFVRRLRQHVASLDREIETAQPELIITDFEPLLPRAALNCGVPFISFDHQHFLTTYDLSSLPTSLRWKAWWMGRFVDAFYSGQQHSIVSSFYFPPLRQNVQNVTQVGVLLRPSILQSRPEVGDHLLVYQRRFAGKNTLQTLRDCGREVRIYGLGERPRDGNLRFFAVDESSFLKSLATCDALISNAGNQLVGEALYLRKPVLAFPEAGNFEQAVNAHFLRQSGGGGWVDETSFDLHLLRMFLDQTGQLRHQIATENICGNDAALSVLRKYLPLTAQPAARTVPEPVAMVA